jgi:hypothetical protein
MTAKPELCVLCREPIDPKDPDVIIITEVRSKKKRRLAHALCKKKRDAAKA